MKPRLIILFLFLTSFVVKASYDPVRLYEMILGADKIVYGEITEMDSLTFTLKVEKNFTSEEQTIKVNKHKNWACAWRWTKYKAGQKLLLFLTETDGEYSQMGLGNESEVIVWDNSIYASLMAFNPYPSYIDSTGALKYISYSKYELYGENYYGLKINQEQFFETIEIVRKCFKVLQWNNERITSIEQVCDEEVINKNCKQNAIFNYVRKNIREKTGGNKK